jgi:hypothetical protein
VRGRGFMGHSNETKTLLHEVVSDLNLEVTGKCCKILTDVQSGL